MKTIGVYCVYDSVEKIVLNLTFRGANNENNDFSHTIDSYDTLTELRKIIVKIAKNNGYEVRKIKRTYGIVYDISYLDIRSPYEFKRYITNNYLGIDED